MGIQFCMRFSVLADFVCGFAVLDEFFFGFAVSSIPQCPRPPLFYVTQRFKFVVYFQDITGWGDNDRGVSWTFGGDVVRAFLKKHDLSLVARAHQVNNVQRFLIHISRQCTLRGGI